MKATAQFFRIFAEEARLEMLWLLFIRRELCVCDIMEVLEITQSKASRHLAVLRNAGLVQDRKAGLWSYYSLHSTKDAAIRAHLDLLKTKLSALPDAGRLRARLDTWVKSKSTHDPCFKNDRPRSN